MVRSFFLINNFLPFFSFLSSLNFFSSDTNFATLLSNYLCKRPRAQEELEVHFKAAFEAWNDYRQANLYRLEQAPWENATSFGLKFFEKDSKELVQCKLDSYDLLYMSGSDEEEKKNKALSEITNLEEKQSKRSSVVFGSLL